MLSATLSEKARGSSAPFSPIRTPEACRSEVPVKSKENWRGVPEEAAGGDFGSPYSGEPPDRSDASGCRTPLSGVRHPSAFFLILAEIRKVLAEAAGRSLFGHEVYGMRSSKHNGMGKRKQDGDAFAGMPAFWLDRAALFH
jgi:hypothetical protein